MKIKVKAATIDLSRYTNVDAVRDLQAKAQAIEPYGNKPEWFGVESVDDLAPVTARVIAIGDPATTGLVERARKEAGQVEIPCPRRRGSVIAHRRVTGQRFDLDRVLAGDPKPWSRFEAREVIGNKIVSLYLPLGGNCDRTAGEIAWSPVAAILLADILEQAGYRVEIWGASTSSSDSRMSRMSALRCSLKAAHDPLDLNAVARAAHPTFFRGMILQHRMVTFGLAQVGHYYGSTAPSDPAYFGDPDGIAMSHSYSLEDALTSLRSTLTRFQEDSP